MKSENILLMVFILMIILVGISERKARLGEIKNFKYFNSLNINAAIKSVDAGAGRDYVVIEDIGKIIFSSRTSELNYYKSFNYTAEPGDSIVKPAFSDTLTLIKQDGKKYRYTFRKYHVVD